MSASSEHPRPIEQRLCQCGTGRATNENETLGVARTARLASVTRSYRLAVTTMRCLDKYFVNDENSLGQGVAITPSHPIFWILDVQDFSAISLNHRDVELMAPPLLYFP